jgi:hypothetical protein
MAYLEALADPSCDIMSGCTFTVNPRTNQIKKNYNIFRTFSRNFFAFSSSCFYRTQDIPENLRWQVNRDLALPTLAGVLTFQIEHTLLLEQNCFAGTHTP